MSIQIFLQGKLLGAREFLASAHSAAPGSDAESVFLGRSCWLGLLSETLPRALLSELGLSKMLLGSSGGMQFLLLLPQEARAQADAFLEAAAAEVETLSGGAVRLLWASTENLGDWVVVRRRLREGMSQRELAREGASGENAFAPFEPAEMPDHTAYFRDELVRPLLDGKVVGWSPETPARVLVGTGKYTWTLGPDADQIPWTRHVALSDDGQHPAGTEGLAARSEGSQTWAVLRGEVDHAGVRFRRAASVEEHIQLSVLYRQFFSGELEVLCSMPEFWRKVTILYCGGDDFAACGSWDALILLARELHRLFRLFAESNLKDFPGAEGKAVSMALELAAEGESLEAVHERAARTLEAAKCSARDSFAVLGRVLEWRQFNGAADLKDTMVKVARESGGSTQFLRELASFYREEVFSPVAVPRKREGELEKPWRLHRRVLRVLPPTRDKDLDRLRGSLIVELVGKNASQVKLRPAGRVALEWARLLTEA